MDNYTHKQKGAALLISLVFLLVLTVIGLSSMNDTILQGKMAGAMQESNIALQGVESAVRSAENLLQNATPPVVSFGTVDGLYVAGDNLDPFDEDLWTDDNSIAGDPVTGLAAAPRFVIQLAGEPDAAATATSVAMQTGYGVGQQNQSTRTYRIISSSTGATTSSKRLVETYYGR